MFDILLAEDNPGDVLLFREALNHSGLPCNLVVASDGQKAMALLDAKPSWHPHLIVLDVNLPKYNGDAVLSYVRGHPHLADIPVIMLTSSASPADRSSAIELGASLYIQKSFDLDELLEIGRTIEKLLNASSSP